jgi:dihydroxyacetone kinase-like protein
MENRTALNSAAFCKMMQAVCRRVQEKKDWLSELDAACGDGDHGVSMGRGFTAIEGQLAGWNGLAPGILFKKVGMSLVSTVGGATGPLLGTVFMEAGKAAGDQAEITATALAAMFAAGLDGMVKRGGAKCGDKTMVDALTPAVEAMKQAADEGASPLVALCRAVDAARAGAESTTNMVSKQGKSRYLGERSLGHPDAEAYSIVTILEALAEAAG